MISGFKKLESDLIEIISEWSGLLSDSNLIDSKVDLFDSNAGRILSGGVIMVFSVNKIRELASIMLSKAVYVEAKA